MDWPLGTFLGTFKYWNIKGLLIKIINYWAGDGKERFCSSRLARLNIPLRSIISFSPIALVKMNF